MSAITVTQAQLLPDNIAISVHRGDDNGFVTMVLSKYSIRDPDHCKYYVDNQSYTSNESTSNKSADPDNFNEITFK